MQKLSASFSNTNFCYCVGLSNIQWKDLNIASRLPENSRRWRARRTSVLKEKEKGRGRNWQQKNSKFQKLFKFIVQFQLDSQSILTSAFKLRVLSLIQISASNRSNELWYPNALWLNDRASSVYPVSFDFALLALTVFTTLREKI